MLWTLSGSFHVLVLFFWYKALDQVVLLKPRDQVAIINPNSNVQTTTVAQTDSEGCEADTSHCVSCLSTVPHRATVLPATQ